VDEDREVHASGRLFAIDSIGFAGAATEGSSLIQATLAVNAFAFSRPVAAPVAGGGAATGVAAVETGAEAASR
jgi:hypothetical protein